MRDLKWIVGLFAICLLLLILIFLFVPTVEAYGITQNTTVVNTTPRIEQGSVVYIDETYDISGVTGWSNQIAWYGKYATEPDYDSTPVVVTLPGRAHTATTSQYYYTISNETFGKYPGRWFQHYIDTDDQHGNVEAFYVELYKPFRLNETNVSGTISYEILNNMTTVIPQRPYILEEVEVSDYLIARGDKFNITVDQLTHAWLFGRVDYLYDHHSINGSIDIQKEFIETLEPGRYTLILHTPSIPNTDFTVRYNSESNTIEWFNPELFAVHKEFLEGCSPQVTLEKIQNIFKTSKDNCSIYNFQLEDPSISIVKMDQIYKNGASVLDVRGYTNVAPGTIITVSLDHHKQSYIGEATGDIAGNMRHYQIYLPLNLNDLPNGVHTISATTAIGGKVFADFVVSELPADSYVPNATLKYIADRNPWVPTPTPEVIIKKEVVNVPGPVVTVTVTPAESIVRAQQEKVVDEKIGFWVPRIITAVIGLIVLLYLISVYLRGKKR